MASTYRYHDMGTPTLRTKFTYSIWLKRSGLGAIGTIASMWKDGNNHVVLRFNSNDTLVFYDYSSSSMITEVATNAVFRDTHAWYHIVVAFDSTQGTAADRTKLYVNGVQQTSLGTATYGAQDNTPASNVSGTDNYLGARGDGANYDGLMSHCHFVDGAVYQASTFGSTDATTGEWKINTSPTITEYGTNGWFMFKDDASLTDRSGKSNNFTNQSGTLTKTEDNPSNVFNVWNRNYLTRHHSESTSIPGMLQNGNTTFNSTANTFKGWKAGTIGVTKGKFYWEAKPTDNGRMYMGVCYPNVMLQLSTPFYESTIYSGVSVNSDGDIFGRYTGSAIDSDASNASIANNDIVGFALDMDNHALYIHKNGTYFESGDPTSGSSRTGSVVEQLTGSRANYLGSGEPVAPMVGDPSSSGTHLSQFNFGNGYFGSTQISSAGTNASGIGIFEYDVPAGYTALCTKGLNE